MDQHDSTFGVQLFIYDLSRGMARQLSPIMLGKQLDGIWHTSVVVYGEEFFYGGAGISSCPPGGTMLGPPDTVVELGNTEVTEEIFMDYLSSLGETTYSGDKYRLFEHNCNTFTNEVAQFLTGNKIPSYITDLPSEVLSTCLDSHSDGTHSLQRIHDDVNYSKSVPMKKHPNSSTSWTPEKPFGQVLRPILDSIHIAPPGGNVINSQNNHS